MRKRRIFLPGIVAIGALLSSIVAIHACRKKEDWPCEGSQDQSLQVVEQFTGRSVEGATAFLVSKPNGSVPEGAYNLTTDSYGRITWNCSWGVTHVCVEAGEAYWDVCGSGYSLQDDFLADGYYELKPKAWVHINFVDTLPLNPEIKVAAFTEYDDSYEAEGLIPGGFYDILGVVGSVHSAVRFRRFDIDGDYITGDLVEMNVPAGDTSEYTYKY